jgi:hypothetical protein
MVKTKLFVTLAALYASGCATAGISPEPIEKTTVKIIEQEVLTYKAPSDPLKPCYDGAIFDSNGEFCPKNITPSYSNTTDPTDELLALSKASIKLAEDYLKLTEETDKRLDSALSGLTCSVRYNQGEEQCDKLFWEREEAIDSEYHTNKVNCKTTQCLDSIMTTADKQMLANSYSVTKCMEQEEKMYQACLGNEN